MTSWVQEALVVVDQGIKMEQDGNEFYLRAAERTKDERGKTMFTALAGDELAHLRFLQAQRQSLVETGSWKTGGEAQAPRDRSQDAPALFPRTPAEVARAVQPDAGDLEALQLGIQAENTSYTFYEDLSRKSADDRVRALFRRLAAEEEGHRQLLQDTYDYLSDPAGWFQQQEKPIFEG